MGVALPSRTNRLSSAGRKEQRYVHLSVCLHPVYLHIRQIERREDLNDEAFVFQEPKNSQRVHMDTKKSRTLFVAAVLAAPLPAFALGICDTSDSQCRGTRTVVNTDSRHVCATHFTANGGVSNFCLAPGETTIISVGPGDKWCFAYGKSAPPTKCERIFINNVRF